MYGSYYNQLDQYKQPYMAVDERIWVNGESQARDYLIAPNGFVRLWDSNRQVFYEKRADASGRPYIDTFEYSRICENKMPDNTFDYMEQIKALESRIKALEEGLNHE